LSYCRWSKLNGLYLYHHYKGYLVCHNANSPGGQYTNNDFETTSRSKMIAYLSNHMGRNNPEALHAIERLKEEIETEGDDVTDPEQED